jgi:hypothetical protein
MFDSVCCIMVCSGRFISIPRLPVVRVCPSTGRRQPRRPFRMAPFRLPFRMPPFVTSANLPGVIIVPSLCDTCTATVNHCACAVRSGMVFDSEAILLGFIREFARLNGFQWSKLGRRRPEERRLRCWFGGKPAPPKGLGVDAATSRKTDCRARLSYAFRQNLDLWILNTCDLDHNHHVEPPAPGVIATLDELGATLMEEIRKMVVSGVTMTKIRHVLLAVRHPPLVSSDGLATGKGRQVDSRPNLKGRDRAVQTQ